MGTVEATGSRVVSPTQTTTYTLTATGADGRAVNAPVTVTVGSSAGTRILSFAPSPAGINAGGSSQLCWNVEGATAVSVDHGVGANLQPVGCASVTPTATTTYTLTATGTDGKTVTASAQVTVGGTRIISFTSDPSGSAISGSAVTLSWTTEGADYVILTGNGTPGRQPANGSFTVHPLTDQSYTLTAYGPSGTVSSVLFVFVR